MTAAGKVRHACALLRTMIGLSQLARSARSGGLCLALLALAPIPAMAGQRYAALSVDANTGQVLHASAADEPRYPASLTKVMTLYITFEQMQLGRLHPDTQLRISEAAASVPPSKLGLKPGSTITVANAIKALVTKSANDIAVALAEHIAGSEDKFAALMTRKAHQLGMRSTTFRNASGLPDGGQTTTARDLATLALRLYDTFPREARIFSVRSFAYGGRTYRNHNTMLANFAGMDGIKTGYTRASGFNLLASVHRDGRHVVAVVLGGRTASARNAHMRLLLGRALQQASDRRTRQRLVVASRTVPRPVRVAHPRPEPAPQQVSHRVAEVAPQPAQRPAAGQSEPWSPQVRLAAPIMRGTSVASRVGANNGWQPSFAPDTRMARYPSTLQAQAARLAVAPPFEAPRADPMSHGRGGGAEIQIGAYADMHEAQDRLTFARTLVPGLLDGADVAIPTVVVGGRRLYRARFVGLTTTTAASACNAFRRRKIDCLVARAN